MTESLRDRVLAALDPVIWRSCLDICQRVNAESIDVGCVLKVLCTQNRVQRRVGSADLPISFCYRLAGKNTPRASQAAVAKTVCTVTPEMRQQASLIVQTMLSGRRRRDVAYALGMRAEYVHAVSANKLRADGTCYTAPAAAVMRVLDYHARKTAEAMPKTASL